MEEPTSLRIRQHDQAPLLFLLQRLPDAGDGATRPRPADEGIDRSIRLLPDLRTRALLMSCKVGEILELIREEAPWRVGVVRRVER